MVKREMSSPYDPVQDAQWLGEVYHALEARESLDRAEEEAHREDGARGRETAARAEECDSNWKGEEEQLKRAALDVEKEVEREVEREVGKEDEIESARIKAERAVSLVGPAMVGILNLIGGAKREEYDLGEYNGKALLLGGDGVFRSAGLGHMAEAALCMTGFFGSFLMIVAILLLSDNTQTEEMAYLMVVLAALFWLFVVVVGNDIGWFNRWTRREVAPTPDLARWTGKLLREKEELAGIKIKELPGGLEAFIGKQKTSEKLIFDGFVAS